MTTTTPVEFESTDTMTDACRDGLRNLLTACADTKLLLGYHYGEWTFGTPELEAAVASCSLAQAELGHVRLLHALLKKHYGEDPDRLVDGRDGAAFANIRYLDTPVEGWPGFVAMNFVVDLAVTRVLHTMDGSGFKPLRMSVGKMLDEERYHVHHGQGWFRTLIRGGGDARDAVLAKTTEALAAAAEWFGPAGAAEDAALVEAGCKSASNADTFEALLGDVRKVAADLGADVPTPPRPDFGGWDPATRRCGTGGPDDEILYHLRGSKNEMFKMA